MNICVKESNLIAGVAKPEPSNADEKYMLRAIELAEGGKGRTSPNPIVGAVVTLDGVAVGEGFHERVGGPHAEINALRQAGSRARRATLYVTLEPCAHQGRTPPCVESILESGVHRVLYAMRDPNELVDGKGEEFLRRHDVEVEVGPYGDIALKQNEAYVKRVSTGIPFVTLKMAESLDGKIATARGDSRWISSEASRDDVQRLRSESDAVMVGVRTVIADDPRLTVRLPELEDTSPLRVVVDSHARTPADGRIASSEAKTVVAVTAGAPDERVRRLESAGVEVLKVGGGERVNLSNLMQMLAKRGLNSVLVEGGGELAAGLWEEGLIDKLILYLAPKIIGGRDAPGPFGGSGSLAMDDARGVSIDSISIIGEDIRVVAYPEPEE